MENYKLFDKKTQAIIFGLQQRAIQRMLDFDYACERETPSIVAIVNPTGGGYHKCFYGSEEIIKIMAEFERKGANLSSNDAAATFLRLCQQMRIEGTGSAQGVSLDDLEAVILGERR